MEQLIRPEWEPNIFAYLYDVIIVTSFEDHLIWLRTFLTALKEVNLQMNWDKSDFCCSEIRYLGYVVKSEDLKTDEDKVGSIAEFPVPTNLKQLRRFLRMIGWYSRFIPNLAECKVPLTYLLRKDVRWQWHPVERTPPSLHHNADVLIHYNYSLHTALDR